jgi:hypothetical protein
MLLYQLAIEYIYARPILGYTKRHNLNMNILSPGDSFAENIFLSCY